MPLFASGTQEAPETTWRGSFFDPRYLERSGQKQEFRSHDARPVTRRVVTRTLSANGPCPDPISGRSCCRRPGRTSFVSTRTPYPTTSAMVRSRKIQTTIPRPDRSRRHCARCPVSAASCFHARCFLTFRVICGIGAVARLRAHRPVLHGQLVHREVVGVAGGQAGIAPPPLARLGGRARREGHRYYCPNRKLGGSSAD
ncbi:MAG: hypothetical protein BMS9Abin07_1892 [Acidimicrobiia bacterium]|nr:MAG: hypothetical protein BMS9Abin07_1892 [Acidimicrobiia bacterium]